MPNVSTITDQINKGKATKISNARLNTHDVLAIAGDKLVINFHSFLTDYWYHLQKRIVTLKLTDKQYRKYKFRPKTLSYDLYGTIEFAPALMQINNIVSISEFDLESPKVFSANIKDFFNEILNKEKATIQANDAQIIKDLKA